MGPGALAPLFSASLASDKVSKVNDAAACKEKIKTSFLGRKTLSQALAVGKRIRNSTQAMLIRITQKPWSFSCLFSDQNIDMAAGSVRPGF